MLIRVSATIVAITLSANTAFAGSCTDSDRYVDSNKVDVNIKVKNDTDAPIIVSIWKGTATEKKTLFADEVSVPSDGKEGKTDKNVTDAQFYFSAKRSAGDTEAVCHFNAYTSSSRDITGMSKSYVANIDYFSCLETGDFDISCEKGLDDNKDRWNVTYSLE